MRQLPGQIHGSGTRGAHLGLNLRVVTLGVFWGCFGAGVGGAVVFLFFFYLSVL